MLFTRNLYGVYPPLPFRRSCLVDAHSIQQQLKLPRRIHGLALPMVVGEDRCLLESGNG